MQWTVKRAESTGNLWKHIRQKHPEKAPDYQEIPPEGTLDNFLVTKPKVKKKILPLFIMIFFEYCY